MCRQKKSVSSSPISVIFFECYIFVLFPYSTNQVFLFLLQSNSTSFKWSSFSEAQWVEAFSISLAVSNQLVEALACVINFACNMDQLKRIPIQRPHLLSIPLGRKGNEMFVLSWSRRAEQEWKEFLAGKTSLERKLEGKKYVLTPRTLSILFSKNSFSSSLWVQHALYMEWLIKAFPFISPSSECIFYFIEVCYKLVL